MTANSVSIIEVRECPSIQQDNEKFEDKRENHEVAQGNEHTKDKRENLEVAKDNEDTKDKGENVEVPKDASRWKSLYTLLILAVFIANTSVFTSIPRNDSILYPEHWYEALLALITTTILRNSCGHILDLFVFTKEQILLSKSHFTKVYVIAATIVSVAYGTSYVIWTLHLGYNHPMPALGILQILPDIPIYMIAFWFLFPSELRSRKGLKRRALIYLIWQLWLLAGHIPQSRISILAYSDSKWQWTFPLIIPLLRISSCWVAQKISKIFPETNNEDVNFLVTTTLTLQYTNLVVTRLYTLQQSTVYGMLIVEILLHMKGCYDIFKLSKKIEEDHQTAEHVIMNIDRRKKVQSLVMSEFVEAILPVAFGIAFTMAYYGPNATLMRGIKNDYFGEQEIDDVHYFYFVLILMFLFDLLAMVMSGIFLNHFCKIDLFQGFCNMMDRYWIIFLIKMPVLVDYFGMRDINYGFDYSWEFLWITDEGRMNLICNSTSISNEEKSFLLVNSTICSH